jgi:hypothetical protein
MKNIQAVKAGNIVNVSINGKLHKKNCGSPQEADELFKLVLKAKDDPSDENVNAIHCYLNEKLRIGLMAGLETDPETGQVYMAGFNTPVPDALVEIIKEYHENNYPMDALINFWKLLMLNPDKRIRTTLFDFIKTHDFVLTDAGYMVVYKAVYDKTEDKVVTALAEFVSREYLKVKKWSKSPYAYVVYKDLSEDAEEQLAITKKVTAETWDEKEKQIEFQGNLGDLFDTIYNSETREDESAESQTPMYTDMHSQSMNIELGKPVRIERRECDADFSNECSYGLHVGATKYVEKFANWHSGNRTILVCYVNPANVVAVPQYDNSKIRVAEYFPFAIANWDGSKIDIIEQAYFESDYTEYELEELEVQLAKIYAEELPIEAARKAEEEQRPVSELLKIIESRMVDIE